MRGHVSTAVWAYKSTLHVNTSRHVIIGTRPSPSLFLHGCEIKAGVGRTGNEANAVSRGKYSQAFFLRVKKKKAGYELEAEQV